MYRKKTPQFWSLSIDKKLVYRNDPESKVDTFIISFFLTKFCWFFNALKYFYWVNNVTEIIFIEILELEE